MPTSTVIAIADGSDVAFNSNAVDKVGFTETRPSGQVIANPSNALATLEELLAVALAHYPLRVLDNIDPSRLADLQDKARVVAEALMERGDARAYALARRMLALTASNKTDQWR